VNFEELGIAVVVQLKIKTKFSCIPDSVVNHIGHHVCQKSKMVESSRKKGIKSGSASLVRKWSEWPFVYGRIMVVDGRIMVGSGRIMITIFDYFRTFSTIFYHFRPFSTIFNYFRSFSHVIDSYRPFPNVFDHFRLLREVVT